MNAKSIRYAAVVAGVAGVILPMSARATESEIDASHSSAEFSVRHMMVGNVKGGLGKVTGTVNLDDGDIAKSTVQATIDATTINTGEPKRDAHLKSADFFDVARFPTLTFKSTAVKKKGATRLAVTGDLTIHGVTKPITLDVELTPEVKSPMGDLRRGAHATTKLQRKDFGLTWNKTMDAGGVVVGDEVAVTLEVELVRKVAPASASK
jgi:polyisoprenoid-binding protein YceI